MAEEFWLTHMRAPHLPEGRYWTREWEAGLAAAHARVDALGLDAWDEGRLTDLADYAGLTEVLIEHANGALSLLELATETREALHAYLDAVWPNLHTLPDGSEIVRLPEDLASRTIGGVEYWFTGGHTTTNDVPSDLWDAVQALGHLDLFAEPLDVEVLA